MKFVTWKWVYENTGWFYIYTMAVFIWTPSVDTLFNY